MELYGTMVLYGIMCILDFGRDFYGFQTWGLVRNSS